MHTYAFYLIYPFSFLCAAAAAAAAAVSFYIIVTYSFWYHQMLTVLPGEKYGRTTVRQHYEYIAKHGQDYDPYTSAYGILKDRKRILEESALTTTTIVAAAVNDATTITTNVMAANTTTTTTATAT